jgi:hypothetical protein
MESRHEDALIKYASSIPWMTKSFGMESSFQAGRYRATPLGVADVFLPALSDLKLTVVVMYLISIKPTDFRLPV